MHPTLLFTTPYRALLLSACLFWLASLATGSRAEAQAIVLRRPALHWVRSDEALSCIDPRTLAEHVESLIGPVLVRPSEAEHTIEGRVDAAGPGRLRVRVRVLDAAGHKVGEREFEQPADDCGTLTPAIVFVIGMAIDPEVGAHGLPPALVALLGGPQPGAALLNELEQSPARAAPEPPALLERPAGKPRARPPAPARASADDQRWQASVFLREAYKEAPRLVTTADARLLYTVRSPLALGGYLRSGAQNGSHAYNSGLRLALSVLDAGLLTCLGAHSERTLRIQGCAGMELSLAHANARGPNSAEAGWVAAFGLVGQLTARVRIRGRWGLALLLTARFSTPRRSFSIDNGALREPTRVGVLTHFSGGLGIGPTYEF